MTFSYAHRFRDTFSVELLQAGVPLERVSVFLGHSSVKVTERQYASWVQKRQQLEADLRSKWANERRVQIRYKCKTASLTDRKINVEYGGEGGIRTHGRGKPTHAFQACSLIHSDTSPRHNGTLQF